MNVESRKDISTYFVVIHGTARQDARATIAHDSGRTADLKNNTLMAKIASSKKWVPFTDETATNGTAIPRGVYVGGDIDAATIAAGDVTDCPIIVGGSCTLDSGLLVIENSKTAATVIDSGKTTAVTVGDALLQATGMSLQQTFSITAHENS